MFRRIIDRLIPSESRIRRTRLFAESFSRDVDEYIRRHGYKAEVVPVGSSVIGTFVGEDYDLDVFVVSEDYQTLFELLKERYPWGHIKKGELLIWNFPYRGVDVDLVFVPPYYEKVATLKHTRFYRENLTPKMRREIVKLKLFLKTYGLYGAEIGGITGIAATELVRRYGSADRVIREMARWKEIPWLQDPVLKKERNLLASFQPSNLDRLHRACLDYMKRGLEYSIYTIERFVSEHPGWVCVVREHDGNRAKAYTVSLHKIKSIVNELKNITRGHAEVEYDVYATKREVVICFRANQPTDYIEVCIPKYARSEHIKRFKEKYPNWYEKPGKICALYPIRVKDYESYILDRL